MATQKETKTTLNYTKGDNNARVKTAKVTQSANEELGMEEKNLYYLLIETEKGKLQINVGEKTHNEVVKLTKI